MIRASRELDPRARGARRLGLLGGSFDPPHAGHLHLARMAKQARSLDHVVFVPAARPPHKPGRYLASARDRVRMLELLLREEDDVSIWTIELERPGPNYTIDTLRALQRELGAETRVFLLLGMDNLRGLAAWREVEEILELSEPVVVPRSGGSSEEDLPPRAREALARGRIESATVDVSSTEIRAKLGRGEDPVELVPAPVAAYLRERGLYASRRGHE